MDKKGLTATVAALVCVSIWGSTFVVSKDLMHILSPLQLMCVRFGVAFVALALVRPVWDFHWRQELAFLGMAVFGNTIYFLTENTALTYTYSSNVSILASTTSLMSLILMWVLKKEPVNCRQTFGSLLAFAGVVLVVLNGTFVLHLEPLGDVLALCAALSWAIYGLFLIRYAKGHDGIVVSRKIMFYGLLTSLPLALLEGNPWDFAALANPLSICEILFLAVLGSTLCYIIWNNSIEKIGVVRSNMFLYLMPIVTVVVGSLALGETITPFAIIGMAMVILGMSIRP